MSPEVTADQRLLERDARDPGAVLDVGQGEQARVPDQNKGFYMGQTSPAARGTDQRQAAGLTRRIADSDTGRINEPIAGSFSLKDVRDLALMLAGRDILVDGYPVRLEDVRVEPRWVQTRPGLLKGKPALLQLLPDVQVYYNAVHYALKYDEFFQKNHVAVAHKLLQQGQERAAQLRDGQAPWTTATGLVVRGYVSKIDDSVQPYGLVVPASYRPGTATQHRLPAGSVP